MDEHRAATGQTEDAGVAATAVDVSIIIVTHEGRELLGDCLESVHLDAAASHSSTETIVVDNASTDGTGDWLRIEHPSVRLITSTDNRGFAAGNNLGIAVARGRYLLLLNSDARLRPGAVAALAAHLDREPHVGMVGPRLLNEDGSLQRSIRGFPTVWRLATEYLYLRRLAFGTRAFNAFYAGDNDHSRECDAEFLMGACLFVRAAAVDRVGAMDEGYFMFSEEADWAWRFRSDGWMVRYLPAAAVVHLGGGTTRRAWRRMFAAQVCGHLRFLAIHRSARSARRARRLLAASLLLRATAYRLGGVLLARRALRERGAAYAAGRRAVLAFDVDAVRPDIPDLDSLGKAVESFGSRLRRG